MREVLIGLAAVAAVAVFEGFFHTFRFVSDKNQEELKRRLRATGGSIESAGLSLLRQGKLSSIQALDGLLRGIPVAERLELLLEQAQMGITVARLMTYSVAAGVFAAMIGFLLGKVVLAAILGVSGLVAPVVVVVAIRERRSLKLSEQLPDALDMMARSLRAGHALSGSFKLVATEMPSPVNIEFGRAFEEQNLGMTLERAVLQMARRAPSNRDLRIFAVSVIIQKETGGNLVEILEKIAETIRGRYRFYGKLRALTAEGRLSATVIGALPFISGVGAAAFNPEYMKLLVTTKMGHGFLIYSLASWLLGIFWLRRMARVSY